MSGTFQLDGELFPRDPLTKRWIRDRQATEGPGEGVYSELWRFELSFGTLAVTGEMDFFMGKYLAAGLHDAFLSHPASGTMTNFTGVSILECSFSFGDVDRDFYALNPRVVLGGIAIV